MSLNVEAVWAIRVVPDDEAEELHEFGLAWYRFTHDPSQLDPVLKIPAKPAVWVRFGQVGHLELIQADFPEAKLGPSSRYTEAILFAESWDKAKNLKEKVLDLLEGEEEEEEGMGKIIREDTMEDY
jgi:hypothetical protein